MLRSLILISFLFLLICERAIAQPKNQLPQDPVKSKSRSQMWGSLSGTFLYEGTPVIRKSFWGTKDGQICYPKPILSERLIVDTKTRGIQNVILWLDHKSSDPQFPIHPDYLKQAGAPVQLKTQNCRFEPHVTLLWTSETLQTSNQDENLHHMHFFPIRNTLKSISDDNPLRSGKDYRFPKAEPVPMKVTCDFHPWMCGWVLLKDHPYLAVTDEKGRFEIRQLPVGNWTFRAWHESVGYLGEVTLNKKKQTWPKGRFQVSIPTSGCSLGKIVLSEQLFKER